MGSAPYKDKALLGRIAKIHGYDGTVIVKTEPGFTENISETEPVFLEVDGIPVPFFIADLGYPGSDILKIRFQDYDSIEKVSEFLGCRVFVTSAGSVGSNVQNDDLTGFRVFAGKGNYLGAVDAIIHKPGQDLLSVRPEGKKAILIPLHRDLILEIDEKSGVIVMDLPEGLTGLG